MRPIGEGHFKTVKVSSNSGHEEFVEYFVEYSHVQINVM